MAVTAKAPRVQPKSIQGESDTLDRRTTELLDRVSVAGGAVDPASVELSISPESTKWWKEGLAALDRDEDVVDARRALLDHAWGGWVTLKPLFAYGERGGGGKPLLDGIDDDLSFWIYLRADEFRCWVAGIAALPQSEKEEGFDPEGELWEVLNHLHVLFVLGNEMNLPAPLAGLIPSIREKLEGYRDHAIKLLQRLDDARDPERAAALRAAAEKEAAR